MDGPHCAYPLSVDGHLALGLLPPFAIVDHAALNGMQISVQVPAFSSFAGIAGSHVFNIFEEPLL